MSAIVANPDFNAELFFGYLSENADDAVYQAIKSQFEAKFVEPLRQEACSQVQAVQQRLQAAVARLLSPLRLLRVASDILVGVVSDLESFAVTALGVTIRIPEALINPVRSVSDSVISVIDEIDNFIDVVNESAVELLSIC